MIILKELSKITDLLEEQTTMEVINLSADLEEGELILWATLYDKYSDTSYNISVKDEVKILTQFQNERILKSLTNRLVNEWNILALDVMVIH